MNTLSWALTQIETGHKVTRKSWTNEWFVKGQGGIIKSNDLWNPHARQFTKSLENKEIEVESYLLFKTAKNKLIMGWTPTQEDIFAEDYVVITTP